MIQPFLKDEAFLEDVRRARGDRDTLHLWWLGQSGFLIHHYDACVLVDPYLSESLTKKYAQTDKPHERLTERVIAPARRWPGACNHLSAPVPLMRKMPCPKLRPIRSSSAPCVLSRLPAARERRRLSEPGTRLERCSRRRPRRAPDAS